MFFAPTALPMPKARITNASQPQKAAFRCLLLQRAIRAARLCDGCESMRSLRVLGRTRAARPVASTGRPKRDYYAPHSLYRYLEMIPTPVLGDPLGKRTAV